MIVGIADRIAAEVGITPDLARQCVTAALRELHRLSIVDEQATTGAILQTRVCFGMEACFHLGGILIESRDGDEAELWNETMKRILGEEDRVFWPLLEEWRVACDARRSGRRRESLRAQVRAGNGVSTSADDVQEYFEQAVIDPERDWTSAVGWCSYRRADAFDFDAEQIRDDVGDARADALVSGAAPTADELRLWSECILDGTTDGKELWYVHVWDGLCASDRPIFGVTQTQANGESRKHHPIGLFDSATSILEYLRKSGRVLIASGVLGGEARRLQSSEEEPENPNDYQEDEEETSLSLGFADQHRQSLEENRPDVYQAMKADGSLNSHCQAVGKSAERMYLDLLEPVMQRSFQAKDPEQKLAILEAGDLEARGRVMREIVLVPDLETERAEREGGYR